MGVPALFRWLSTKCPKIISPVVEDGSELTAPNPNGELDNLYLDMNGIVHPCSHPENKPAPENEAQMMLEVFKYTDRVIQMARPRKVLMIAIDGVAPRAKMNQQRSRRFRSARDARVTKHEIETIANIRRQQDLLDGKIIDDSVKTNLVQWDSNAITPGTPFMDTLALSLRYWVAYKLSHDAGWADLQVIISDSSIPGEGEHKIMNFVRSQRLNPQYNPNTTHCIYGLDADLIFLGLATHEPHFRILREDVFAKFSKGPSRNLSVQDSIGMAQHEKDRLNRQESQKPFLWLNIHILREYLQIELMTGINIPELGRNLDLERCLDDWIFLCFFIGNDFLPSLPSLNVRDGSIDMLVQIWKQNITYLFNNKKKFNNDYYLTRDGHVNLLAVEVLLKSLSSMETGILRKKHSKEIQQAEFFKRKEMLKNNNKDGIYKGAKITEDKTFINQAAELNKVMPVFDVATNKVANNVEVSAKELVKNPVFKTGALGELKSRDDENSEAAELLKLQLMKKRKLDDENETANKVQKTESAEKAEEEDDYDPENDFVPNTVINSNTGQIIDNNDVIKVWEPGYSDRYYKLKFSLTEDQVLPFKKRLLKHYLEGVTWTLLYYYQGCPSWNWFYPYHYAPFASDFAVLDFKDLDIKLDKGTPFRPFEQLMSVLPADSAHNLPTAFHDLMKNPDSGIIEYYPEYFDIDMNGSKQSWHGIPLLPFIDEAKLLSHVQAKYSVLSEKEMLRNTNKEEIIMISSKNKWFEIWKLQTEHGKPFAFGAGSTNLSGLVTRSGEYQSGGYLEYPLNEVDHDVDYPATISSNLYLTVGFDFYSKVADKINKSMILNGFVSPVTVLTPEDKNNIIYGGGSSVRQKRGFTHNQNQNINFAMTIGPPKEVGSDGKEVYKTEMYKTRAGGYLAMIGNGTQNGHNYSSQNGNHNGNYNSNYNGNYNEPGNYNGHGNYNGRDNYNGHGTYNGRDNYNQGPRHNQGYNQGRQGYNQNYGLRQNYQGQGQGQNYQGQGYQAQGYQAQGQRITQRGRGGYPSRGRGGFRSDQNRY